MDKTFMICYIAVSVFIAAIDIFLAVKSIRKKLKTGRYLGFACAGAAVVDISYLISIMADSYICMSVMSSIYFVSIDFMLICLMIFTVYFTRQKFTRPGRKAAGLMVMYAAFELIVFAVNPFYEIAVHYVRRDTSFALYSYVMMPLYWMHLIFTYILVAVIIILMIRKMMKIPGEYRSPYTFVVAGIVAIVCVNAVFLFMPGINMLDYSICAYSLTAFLLYWSCFDYSTHGMLNRLKTSIFENIDQGIVLFDYNDNFILNNARADYLLGGIDREKCAVKKNFLESYGISMNSANENDSFAVQCYIKNDGEERPLRCDIRQLKNSKEQKLGQLFVFSDAALETDLLTGFQNWESFRMLASDAEGHFPSEAAVAVCDINSLSVINSTMGYRNGNQRIRLLAGLMREEFPKQTYYVRGNEANLIAICSSCSEKDMQECLDRVRERFDGNIQFAVSSVNEEMPDILSAVNVASAAMRAKKLLDRESIHSEMMTSLIRALQECDSDTEHHVRRTQHMGARLGKRIQLTDFQQSQLSLLCLLHDIGKIGIPLEILNKPGKLSDEEWKIIKTHTRKGYEIAASSSELKGIADEIRHHHERWDGKGYPDGLSCESIPLLSRVIAVVDAYDAMTNDRSYRSAMSAADAVRELKRCAGSQFDPYIVSEFIGMLKDENVCMDDDICSETEEAGTEAHLFNTGENGYDNPETSCIHPLKYSRYILDDTMHIVFADESFEGITGYSPEDAVCMKLTQSDLIPDEERMEYLCRTNESLAKSPLVFQEHRLKRRDGVFIYVLCLGRVYYDSAVRQQRSEIIIADVTNTYSMKMLTEAEEKKAQVRLRYWERTYRRDSLTGLLNHAAFRSDVELKILEGKTRIMMLMIDVDKFKEYNDSFGHHEGDKLLVLTAQTLLTSMRKEDRACRMGGDEFAAVLFYDMETPESKMKERAYQIFDKLSMTLKASGKCSGISAGVVIAGPETSFNKLYESSDAALYSAKQSGRDKLVIA